MFESNVAEADLIKELRLRRWARMNYVSAEERDDAWSSIVLDEMRRKDAEIQEAESNQIPVSSYVPLAPMSVHAIHGSHSDWVHPSRVDRAPEYDKIVSESY